MRIRKVADLIRIVNNVKPYTITHTHRAAIAL